MEKATQFSVLLANEPGALAELCRALADAGINILGISVAESSEHGMVRLVVDNPKAAGKAIERRGALFSQTEVFVLRLANRPGVLASVAARLGANKINIKYVYGTATGAGSDATLVIAVEKMSQAEKLLADL